MKQDIPFMALGGAQRIGASCYFIRIGSQNILLDAGIDKKHSISIAPDYYALETSPYIQSMEQIDQIFISHAHSDHIGYLPNLMQQCPHATVYMTPITAALAEFQFSKYDDLSLLQRIFTVNYLQTLDFISYRATFFPAGHIPGAMMIFLEDKYRNVLYTGDYSFHNTTLSSACMVPQNIELDTMILCGLHAKHPNNKSDTPKIAQQAKRMIEEVHLTGKRICSHTKQMTKGIEWLQYLHQYNQYHIPIYIDIPVMRVAEVMERKGIPILSADDVLYKGHTPKQPHIFITTSKQVLKNTTWNKEYHVFEPIQFRTHDSFTEMQEFIKQLNPKQVVCVHCGTPKQAGDDTIEQALLRDGENRSQFLFPEEKECYLL